jgi:hypothetical protein
LTQAMQMRIGGTTAFLLALAVLVTPSRAVLAR